MQKYQELHTYYIQLDTFTFTNNAKIFYQTIKTVQACRMLISVHQWNVLWYCWCVRTHTTTGGFQNVWSNINPAWHCQKEILHLVNKRMVINTDNIGPHKTQLDSLNIFITMSTTFAIPCEGESPWRLNAEESNNTEVWNESRSELIWYTNFKLMSQKQNKNVRSREKSNILFHL